MAKDNTVQIAEPNRMNGNSKKNNHIAKASVNNKSHSNSMSIEEKFNAAVDVIRNLPKNGSFQPSDQLKLKFYSLFKQAKEGCNKAPKPPFYDVVARYKWDSWTKLGDMTKEEAMQNYVNELKQIVDAMPINGMDPELYAKLDPIFDLGKKNLNGNKPSSQAKLNGKNQRTKESNPHDSSSDSSDSDDFSDTVDNLSLNGDSKPNLNNKDKENGDFNSRHNFEDCTDVNSRLKPGDLINAKGQDANYLSENYFYDCIDKGSVLNPNDIICARGETGIFSSRTSLPINQEQSATGSSTLNQPISIDNNFVSDGSFYQSSGGSGGDRNFNRQRSELSDIHEHLALTVLRLQQTVKSISNKIEELEAKVNERPSENKRVVKKQSWWSNPSTQTTVLLILWPFAAHLIISAIKKKVNK